MTSLKTKKKILKIFIQHLYVFHVLVLIMIHLFGALDVVIHIILIVHLAIQKVKLEKFIDGFVNFVAKHVFRVPIRYQLKPKPSNVNHAGELFIENVLTHRSEMTIAKMVGNVLSVSELIHSI